MRVHGRAVRAEIPGAVLDEPAGDRHPGELLVSEAYPRVGLAVLEQDVVTRLILLYKVVLQQERIGFRPLGLKYCETRALRSLALPTYITVPEESKKR